MDIIREESNGTVVVLECKTVHIPLDIVIGCNSKNQPVSRSIKPIDIEYITDKGNGFCSIKLVDSTETIDCNFSAHELINKRQVCKKVTKILRTIFFKIKKTYINYPIICLRIHFDINKENFKNSIKDLINVDPSDHILNRFKKMLHKTISYKIIITINGLE